jgi:tRNA (cytidine/uridine-2'-O-)-methyltransferase
VNILLFEPQIPQNTGNIIRTCSVTGSSLILVRPLGFSLTDKHLKRAGLDYGKEVDISYIDDLMEYLENEDRPFYFFSSKVQRPYTDLSYSKDAILIFGSETSGLPEAIHKKFFAHFATIPMKKNKRCLNLSNAVSIVLYEGLRQQNFAF